MDADTQASPDAYRPEVFEARFHADPVAVHDPCRLVRQVKEFCG
jgi:hypothetical protein